MFEAFSPAMAGESHGRAARGGIVGDAVQVVDGALSVGRMGGAWRGNGLAMAFSLRRAELLRLDLCLLRSDLCLLRLDRSW